MAMGDLVRPVCADLRLVVRRHGGSGRRLWSILLIVSAVGAGIALLLLVLMFISSRRHRRAEREEDSETGADEQQPGEQPATPPTYEEVFGLERGLDEGGLPRAPEDEEDGRRGRAVGSRGARMGRNSRRRNPLPPRRGDSGSPKRRVRLDADLDEAVDQVDALDADGDSRTTSGGCVRSSRPGPRRPRSASSSGRPSSTRPRQPRIRSDRRAGDAGLVRDRRERRSDGRQPTKCFGGISVRDLLSVVGDGRCGRSWRSCSPSASLCPPSWCAPNGTRPSTAWSSGRGMRRSLRRPP